MPRLIALVFALTWFAAACSSDGGPDVTPLPPEHAADPAYYAARGPHGVGVTTVELVDTSRPTAPNGEYAGAADRRLPLEIWYPAALGSAQPEARDVAVEDGPYPLIVFAHGLSSFRRQSAAYAQHLASHGFVVASPDFPSSNLASPGGARISAVLEQPGDVSFIIDEMQRFNAETGNRFAGALDGRVGITGHSLGGLTSLLTAYGPMRDERVTAFLPISAPACFLDASLAGDTSVPIMHLGGSEDLIVDPAWIRRGYDISNAPRYFVDLRGADHVGFIDFDLKDEALLPQLRSGLLSNQRVAGEAAAITGRLGGSASACALSGGQEGYEPIANERQRELLRLFGALFFDAYLRGDEGAMSLLRTQGALDGIAPEAAIEFQ